MANINNINISRFLRKANCTLSGTSENTSYYSSSGAAKTAGLNYTSNIYPTYANAGAYSNSTYYTLLRLGDWYTEKTDTVTTRAALPSTYEYRWVYDYTVTRPYYQSLIFVTFDLPTNITANDISTANLTLKLSSGSLITNEIYYILAPKANEVAPSGYITYTGSGRTVNLFTGNSGTTTYTINIKEVLKQCIETGENWLIITVRDKSQSNMGVYYGVVSNVSISYDLAFTKCSAPTNISSSNSIIVPNGSTTISWSGATAGTNNSISGYTVYWKENSAPTTSLYTGTLEINDNSITSYTFNFTNATRGSIYYFKVVTKGAAGNSYYSDISSAQATTIINSLPDAPTVSVDKTRIKSTGDTIVTFIVTAGANNDTSQTKTLYYATSPTGTKTVFTSPLSETLSTAITYYFWTYDGLEYSSDYTSLSFTVNTAPSITSITMSPYNNVTYLPVTRDGYATNINGSAIVTKDTAATLTYLWYLCVGSTASATTYGTETLIGNSVSLNNIDVTLYGVSFNKAYKLKLVITDDIGETAENYSSNVYAIPAASSSTNIYNNNNNNNVDVDNSSDVGNSSNFGRYIRVKYSLNTGIVKLLLYSIDSNFGSGVTTVDLTGDTYLDIDLNLLTRGTQYYFKVVCTCNTLSSTLVTRTMTRVTNIIPNITDINPTSGTYVKPYTHSIFTCVFTNLPVSWTNANNVSTNYSDIYTIKIKYGNQSLTLTSTGSNSSGTVTSTITLNNKAVENWITLINGGGSSAPMGTLNVILEVTATNIFGESFSNTANFTVDFRESLIITSTNNIVLSIKTGDSTYTTIPTATYSSSNRYPLFSTQTILFAVNFSGLESYVNQPAILKLTDGTNVIATESIASADWTRKTGDNFKYYLNINKILQYTVPFISVDTNLTFVIELSYENINYSSYNVNTGSTFNYCKYVKINTSEVAFNITGVTEDGGNITINYVYSANGGGSNAYSSQTADFIYATSPNADFTSYSNFKTTSISVSSSAASTSNASVATFEDILYFGVKVNLTAAFLNISGARPTGTDTYSVIFLNLNALYRTVPNLIYGKNFFGINTNSPGSHNDGILYIHLTNSRSKIYFGDQDLASFEITNNGLTLNGVSLNNPTITGTLNGISLNSPTITGGTFTNPTITGGTISGVSLDINGGTWDT